jgi:hypothetical protein
VDKLLKAAPKVLKAAMEKEKEETSQRGERIGVRRSASFDMFPNFRLQDRPLATGHDHGANLAAALRCSMNRVVS